MVGMLAISKAGHDKGTVYVIVSEEEEYVYLSDGRTRCLNRPKRKNKKHIQIIKKTQFVGGEQFTDLEIQRSLKEYLKSYGDERRSMEQTATYSQG